MCVCCYPLTLTLIYTAAVKASKELDRHEKKMLEIRKEEAIAVQQKRKREEEQREILESAKRKQQRLDQTPLILSSPGMIATHMSKRRRMGSSPVNRFVHKLDEYRRR